MNTDHHSATRRTSCVLDDSEDYVQSASERRLAAIFAHAPVGLSEISSDGRFLRVNSELCRMFGRTRDELLGMRVIDITHPDDRAATITAFELISDAGELSCQDKRYLRPDGTVVWANSSITRLPGAAGEAPTILAVTADFTARRQTEEDLRESRQQFATLVEHLPDVVFRLDRSLIFLYVSPNAAQAFGLPASGCLGKSVRELGLPDPECAHFEADCHRAFNTGQEVQAEYVRLDRQLRTRLIPERNSNGWIQSLLGITEDFTQQRMAERRRLSLERETTLLQERNRMAQELHDTLSQGFTGIRLQLDVALYALDEELPQVDEATHHIRRARQIAQDSQLEARSSIRALRSPLLDNGSLTAAFERLATEAAGPAKVVFAVEGTPFPLASLAENDLYRIGQEALSNALQHSHARNIVISLTYRADQVCLTVTDDGRGFDSELGRAGFGITGMHERALRLGAALSIRSQVGQGTQVTLALNSSGDPDTC